MRTNFAVSRLGLAERSRPGAGLGCCCPVHLGKDNRQFRLHVFLGALIVVVRQFADPILELQVAQIFVDRGFARLQMLNEDLRERPPADPAIRTNNV